MASAAIFSPLRRRRSPSLQPFLAPVHLPVASLLPTLSAVATDLVSSVSGTSFLFHRKNCRSLLRKIESFALLLDHLGDSGLGLSPTATTCLKELYLLLHRSKLLLDCCAQSSKLWLLLHTHSISGHFHDLNRELSSLLDVLPVNELELGEDLGEMVELLRTHLRSYSKVSVDEHEEAIRVRFFSIQDGFRNGLVPDCEELRVFVVEELGIRDAKSCRAEIDFLEEWFLNNESDVELSSSMLCGYVALMRYCRFSVFGFEEDEVGLNKKMKKKPMKGYEIGDTYVTIPRDFCCPISLDLMREPVVISTGQTYDRRSIARWIEEGHFSCPKTGQILDHTDLIPNRALRNLILHWCSAYKIPYDPLNPLPEPCAMALPAIEANRATALLLIQQLESGSECAKTLAAHEIRLLAKRGMENRALIAELGAIPLLKKLLLSPNPVVQENSVTAMLNLSIYEKNKRRIVDEEECLGSIIKVLRFGATTDARENAAATLFSLSAIHDYKKRIAAEEGTVEALAGLLGEGTLRGKKDAVMALFNLSTHKENCVRMIEAGAIAVLVEALGNEGVSEEAAGALALLVKQQIGAKVVAKEEMTVRGLVGIMRNGTPRGKESAVSALLDLCRGGGEAATKKVVKAPTLACLLHGLLLNGTKRARRKAASLARLYQSYENGTLQFCK